MFPHAIIFHLLTYFLWADYIKSCASIEVCRQVVVAMDKEKTSLGRLGYPQFKDLIVSLKLWQGVFRSKYPLLIQ